MTAAEWQHLVVEKLDKVLQQQAATGQTLVSIQQRLDEHGETLYGNGRPGLKERAVTVDNAISGLRGEVTRIQRRCAEQHKPPGAWSKIWPTIVSTVIAAVVLGILAWAMGLWRDTTTKKLTQLNYSAQHAQKGPTP